MKVMIYDNTDLSRSYDVIGDSEPDIVMPSLSYAWLAGAKIYKMTGEVDACKGVSSWVEALEYLIKLSKDHEITEVQFWGHGSPGKLWINSSWLNMHNLRMYDLMNQLRNYIPKGGKCTWWFRTCSTFAGKEGVIFAENFSSFFDSNVVGHTCTIGTWGLHSYGYGLRAGHTAHWEDLEDKGYNLLGRKMVPKNSWFGLPNTINCLQSKIPESWWAGGNV